MTQLSKRSLRERKTPKTFDSDNEQQDPWGYAKHSYAKEQRNPIQQLNSDARLLVKFLTSINKSYKEQEIENKKKNQRDLRIYQIYKPKPSQNDIQKRRRDMSVEPSPETSRKGKESFQITTHNHIADSTPRALNKQKATNNQSATKVAKIENTINKNRQLSTESNNIKLQKMKAANKEMAQATIFKKANPTNYVKIQQKTNGFPFQTQHSFFTITKQKEQKVNELASNLNVQKPTIAENKLFKRSAYHVAIAYHIYLNKLRAKGTFTNEIDPTYYARKLKENMHKRP